MSSDHGDECEPLLRSPVLSVSGHSAKSSRTCWPRFLTLPAATDNVSQQQSRIIICVFCLQFLINFSKNVVEVPLIRLFEIAICNRYFQTDAIAENLCKAPRIQNDLAIIVGWRSFFDALPGLLSAIIYGHLADKHGRRLVLFLSCLGLLCSLVWIVFVCYTDQLLPIQLVWASSAFVLVVSCILPCIGSSYANRGVVFRVEGKELPSQWYLSCWQTFLSSPSGQDTCICLLRFLT